LRSIKRWLQDEFPRLRLDLCLLVVSAAALFILGAGKINLMEFTLKVCLFTFALTYLHITRKSLFPYLDLGACITGLAPFKAVPDVVRAACVVGLFLFYSIGILAFLTGL